MNLALAKYEFSEVLVRCQQNRAQLTALPQNCLIIYSGVELGDKVNIMPIGPQTVNNPFVDAFVGDDFHPATFSTG